MSMSQEEIEALMNGLDIEDDASDSKEELPVVEEKNSVINTDEIEELISQNEDVKIQEPKKTENETLENNDIDALLKELEITDKNEKEVSNEDSKLESSEVTDTNDITPKSFDDVSADEEGIVESTNKVNIESNNEEEIGKNWAGSKINEGVFPLPADNDTKVVNQLSQVANDSEEKVSQIFDVLSLALDNNSDIRNKIESFENYINSELELLNSLSTKFPNIEVFNTQKTLSIEMSNNLKDMSSIVNSEDKKIYEAMELMQFNDINRQKIERVMSVIRRLSLYLNNLFEDDGSTQEIAVAKHIPGDANHDLIGDDLDKLIDEFGK
ncbi:hypothetical protein [Poseidonibacter antarcticus]|uniref:hypothetical protein n=1 Tax=Poseidonibacter antarcticus TaxID=2478538 RepID=UPI000EF4BE34|nr:hypothetical protein [Poseidonibacter antarcticus]